MSRAAGYGALLETADGGANWLEVQNFPFSVEGVWFTSVRFLNDSTGWVLVPPGLIFKTTNGGNTWSYSHISGVASYMTGFMIDELEAWLVGSVYVGGTPPFVYHSTDGWETWAQVYPHYDNSIQSVFFIDDKTGWIVGDNGMILHTTTGGIEPEQ